MCRYIFAIGREGENLESASPVSQDICSLLQDGAWIGKVSPFCKIFFLKDHISFKVNGPKDLISL